MKLHRLLRQEIERLYVMFRFMIQRVKKKIFERRRIYSIIICQMILGIFFLGCVLNIKLNIEKKADRLIESGEKEKFYVQAQVVNEDFSYDINSTAKFAAPMELEEIKEFQEQNKDLDLQFICQSSLNLFYKGVYYDCNVEYSNKYNTVQMSQNTYKILCSDDVLDTGQIFVGKIENNEYTTKKGEHYPIEFIDDDSIVFMPMQIYEDVYNPFYIGESKLYIYMKDAKVALDKIAIILEMLNRTHTEYSYSINNEYYTYVNSSTIIFEQSKCLSYLGYILILIIVIGISGLFLIITDSRKNENAICMAIGESKYMVCLENFVEIFSICFFGGGIGILLSLIPSFAHYTYEGVTMYVCGQSIIFLILLILLISIISTLPSLFKMIKFMPITILRSE